MKKEEQYKIVHVDILMDSIEKQKDYKVDELEFNKAQIFSMPDHTLIVLPENGKSGYIFWDRKKLDEMIVNQLFPEVIPDNIFFPERSNIEKLNDNPHYFWNEIRKKLALTNADTELFSIPSRKLIIDKVNQYGFGKFMSENPLLLGIVIGECIRKEKNGYWKIQKVFELNPYFIPNLLIHNNNGAVFPLSIFKELREYGHRNKDFSFEQFYDFIFFNLSINPVKIK